MFKYLDRGKTHADNLIDNLLSFNVGSTWTTVGTGTALIDNNEYFEGSGSLRLTNNAYKTTELTANNSVQSTIIPFDGTYDFSLYLKKTLAEDMSIDVEIYSNASLVYDTTFTFSDVDNWTSFITNENFSFLKGDVITFRFKINNNASSAVTSASLWIDGLHLYNKERNQLEAPIYSKTVEPSQPVYGFYNYQHAGGSQAISASTWTDIDNDGLGALTSVSAGYPDKTNILDVSTNEIDFSNLSLYDSVKIRVDTDSVVTTSGNDTVRMRILLAEGVLDVPIPLFNQEFDATGTQEDVFGEVEVYMLSQATIDNPAKLQIWCNQAVTLNLNGFNFKVQKRLI